MKPVSTMERDSAIIAEKLAEARARRDALVDAGPYRRRQAERRVAYWRARLAEAPDDTRDRGPAGRRAARVAGRRPMGA